MKRSFTRDGRKVSQDAIGWSEHRFKPRKVRGVPMGLFNRNTGNLINLNADNSSTVAQRLMKAAGRLLGSMGGGGDRRGPVAAL